MRIRTQALVLILPALLAFAGRLVAADGSLEDRIREDVKRHRIHSLEGETAEAERPVIAGDRALDPVSREPLEVIILRAEAVVGSLKYAAFHSPERKVYWTFVWGGPRDVRIIHGPFPLSDLTRADVERAIRKLITPEGNYGFYEGQFKEIIEMGAAAVPHLLELFVDESKPEGVRVLSIEALADLGDKSVVPRLREFLAVQDYQPFHSSIIFTLAKLGDMEPANKLIESFQNGLKQYAGDARVQAFYYSRLAHAYARLENQEKALENYRKAIEADPENAYMHYYNMACALAVMNRVEEALDALEKAVEEGYEDYDWMKMDGDLKNLHGHPRFERLLERLKGK